MSHHLRIYRAMKLDTDGKPLCGETGNKLGVRPGKDILADSNQFVHPKTGGLSVTPDDPKLLPPHVRPLDLGGKGRLPVFILEMDALDQKLSLRRDPTCPLKHAFIEPAASMPLTTMQTLLCSTRNQWEKFS